MRKLNTELRVRRAAGGYEISKTGDYENWNGTIVLGYDESKRLLSLLEVCLRTDADVVIRNTKIEDE